MPANRGDEPLDLWELEDTLGHEIDLIIDGGEIFPQDSTIIELINDQVEVVREGVGDVSWVQQRGAVGE